MNVYGYVNGYGNEYEYEYEEEYEEEYERAAHAAKRKVKYAKGLLYKRRGGRRLSRVHRIVFRTTRVRGMIGAAAMAAAV